jgi:hypothetical protein
MNLISVWKDKYYGTDKGDHNYIKYYNEWFEEYQNKEINLLEVGVENGGSIRLWEDYFTNGTIYGMDIKDGGNFKCDSTDKKAVDEQLGDLKFDIIIDDGDHNPISQVKTYMNLEDRLNDGGIYIIEDIPGPKYANYIYEKEVDKIKSLGFEVIDTDGKFTLSYLGVIRT